MADDIQKRPGYKKLKGAELDGVIVGMVQYKERLIVACSGGLYEVVDDGEEPVLKPIMLVLVDD